MWFRKKQKPAVAEGEERAVRVPEGLWTKCESCGQIMFSQTVAENGQVCPKCNYHFRISARERLESLFDEGAYEEFDAEVTPTDPLQFKDTKKYADRLVQYQRQTGLKDAVINARGTMGGLQVVISCMEYAFMGGSMGSVVGEKITRAAEESLRMERPPHRGLLLRRGAHAGIRALPHADGQGRRGPGAPPRGAVSPTSPS